MGFLLTYFFLPSPSPSPILNPSTSPLKSVFDSSQLSGSINVQDGGTTLFLKTIHGSRSKIRLLCRLNRLQISFLNITLFEKLKMSFSASDASYLKEKLRLFSTGVVLGYKQTKCCCGRGEAVVGRINFRAKRPITSKPTWKIAIFKKFRHPLEAINY